MSKTEPNRVLAWRQKVIRVASAAARLIYAMSFIVCTPSIH
jgi:hypothetical protein